MYEKPQLERFGQFRELTQFNWCRVFPRWPGCGVPTNPGGDDPTTS